MYTIVYNGRIAKFRSLEIAKIAASDIFEKTGIIVGIEKE